MSSPSATPSRARPVARRSILASSAGARLGMIAPLLALLWLAFAWAWGGGA